MFIRSWLSVSELEYFLSVENTEISLYAQAWQSPMLLSQGNIYNCLRFLNKYLVLLKELNDLFQEIVQNFWLRQASSFLKTVLGCRVCRHFLTWKLKCTYYHMNMYISQPLLKVYGWKNEELLIHYSDFITITPYLERFKPLVFCWWS